MERYSLLYGTTKEEFYQDLAASKGLLEFFKRIQAENYRDTKNAVLQALGGFSFKEGYYQEKLNNCAPVSVRYAPMHLYKLENMPGSIKPFAALSVNGCEHRSRDGGDHTRDTFYSHTLFIAQELMHHSAEGYCYLDQLFGTNLTSWKDVQEFRNGAVASIDLDAAPALVTPRLRLEDKAVVLATVEEALDSNPVVLLVEPDSSFNFRSWGLLTQIYSLLYPIRATEVGFATYVDQTEVRNLLEKTSIKIFVAPASVGASGFPASCRVIDLSGPAPASSGSAARSALEKWYRLPWSIRRESMEAYFDRLVNAAGFVEVSNRFFQEAQAFDAWQRAKDNEGTVSSLSELRALEAHFAPILQTGWARERFQFKLPRVLKPELKLETLTAAQITKVHSDAEKQLSIPKDVQDDYIYALSLTDKRLVRPLYDAVARQKNDEASEQLRQQERSFQHERDAHNQALSELENKHQKDLDQTRKLYEDTIRDKDRENESMRQAKVEAERKMQEEQGKRNDLEREKQRLNDQLSFAKSDLQRKTEEWDSMKQARDQARQNLDNEKKKISGLEAARDKAESENSKLNTSLETEKKKAKRAEEQYDSEKERRIKAENALEEAERKLRKVNSDPEPRGGKPEKIPWWAALVTGLVIGALVMFFLRGLFPTKPVDNLPRVTETPVVETEEPTPTPAPTEPEKAEEPEPESNQMADQLRTRVEEARVSLGNLLTPADAEELEGIPEELSEEEAELWLTRLDTLLAYYDTDAVCIRVAEDETLELETEFSALLDTDWIKAAYYGENETLLALVLESASMVDAQAERIKNAAETTDGVAVTLAVRAQDLMLLVLGQEDATELTDACLKLFQRELPLSQETDPAPLSSVIQLVLRHGVDDWNDLTDPVKTNADMKAQSELWELVSETVRAAAEGETKPSVEERFQSLIEEALSESVQVLLTETDRVRIAQLTARGADVETQAEELSALLSCYDSDVIAERLVDSTLLEDLKSAYSNFSKTETMKAAYCGRSGELLALVVESRDYNQRMAKSGYYTAFGTKQNVVLALRVDTLTLLVMTQADPESQEAVVEACVKLFQRELCEKELYQGESGNDNLFANISFCYFRLSDNVNWNDDCEKEIKHAPDQGETVFWKAVLNAIWSE